MNSKYKIMQNKLFFAFLFSSCKNENNQNVKVKENQPTSSESKVDLKSIDQEVIKEYIKNLSDEEFEKVTGSSRPATFQGLYEYLENIKNKKLKFNYYSEEKQTFFAYDLFIKFYEKELKRIKIKIDEKEYSLYEFLNNFFSKNFIKLTEVAKNNNQITLCQSDIPISDQCKNKKELKDISLSDFVLNKKINSGQEFSFKKKFVEKITNLEDIIVSKYLELRFNSNGISSCNLQISFQEKKLSNLSFEFEDVIEIC